MLVTRVWRRQPGKFFCISTKSATKEWRDHFFKREELDDVLEFVRDNEDKDIYFCPHGFSKPQRRKEFAVPPKLFWSDMDAVDPDKIKWQPTIAIESSPGRYVGLWETDRPVDDELNRRLVYAIGADKGGWDFTQVLRVPGTRNYKYDSTPKVKTLWSDGPAYRLEDMKLPQGVTSEAKKKLNGTADLYHKWEKKLAPWLRKALLDGKPRRGDDRSQMLWRMESTLLELGLSTDEAFELIRHSAWNKFKDRRNGDEQLRRELEKAVDAKFKPREDDGEEDEEWDRYFKSMDTVEERNIDWVYYPYLARQEVTILEGDPGLGKSYLMQMIAAGICDGGRLPSMKPKRVQGKVVYFDLENSSDTVTKRRLATNGLKNMENYIQCEEPFSIADDEVMEKIYRYLQKVKPVLVVFDTLNTYLGGADAFKGHEVAQVFKNFKMLATEFNCSVVVLRHLTKGSGRALYRGQGSMAFAGLARIIMTVGVDPEDPDTRVLAHNKFSNTGRQRSIEFTIEALPDTLKLRDRSRFVWGDFCDYTADEILEPPKKKDRGECDDAKKFLERALADEEVDLTRLQRMAEKASVTKKAMMKAASEMGITKRSHNGKELWSMPTQRKDED